MPRGTPSGKWRVNEWMDSLPSVCCPIAGEGSDYQINCHDSHSKARCFDVSLNDGAVTSKLAIFLFIVDKYNQNIDPFRIKEMRCKSTVRLQSQVHFEWTEMWGFRHQARNCVKLKGRQIEQKVNWLTIAGWNRNNSIKSTTIEEQNIHSRQMLYYSIKSRLSCIWIASIERLMWCSFFGGFTLEGVVRPCSKGLGPPGETHKEKSFMRNNHLNQAELVFCLLNTVVQSLWLDLIEVQLDRSE
jgi:hypothetical protein